MAATVFDVLREHIGGDKASAVEFLASGGCKDYAQYKDVCGLVRGLESALRYMEDLSRNHMEDDDNE
tara:strand:- start:671 stop:871 length:201 start_codon:yes stop_codon:yes gene_type:complete